MRTFKNETELVVTRQPESAHRLRGEYMATVMVPLPTELAAQDKIAMGTQLGTRGNNAGFPVNVFLCVTEIFSSSPVNLAGDAPEPTHTKVTAKVIRQEL